MLAHIVQRDRSLERLRAVRASRGGSVDDGGTGPQAGLEAFARDHGQSLMRFAWLLTRGDHAASQDLVQTALLKMHTHGFDRIDHPQAFARRLMTNQQHDRGRHDQVFQRIAPSLVPVDASAPAAAVEERDELFAALHLLSERERAVLVLRYYEDYDDPVIAEVVGCTRSSVRTLARRGLMKMRSHLGSDPTNPKEQP